MDATKPEWSPAERLVSGAAPSAISPTVEVQSVPRLELTGLRQPQAIRHSEKISVQQRLTAWEVPVAGTTPLRKASGAD